MSVQNRNHPLLSLNQRVAAYLASFMELKDLNQIANTSKHMKALYGSKEFQDQVVHSLINSKKTVFWLVARKASLFGKPYITIGDDCFIPKSFPASRSASCEERVGKYGFNIQLVPAGQFSLVPRAIRVTGPNLRLLDLCDRKLPAPELVEKEGQLASFTVEAKICVHGLHPAGYMNPIVSKHGPGLGWELRICPNRGPWITLTFVSRAHHVELGPEKPSPVPMGKWFWIAASWDAKEHVIRLWRGKEKVLERYLSPEDAKLE